MAVTTTAVLTESVRALYNAGTLMAFTENGQFWKSATIKEADGTGSSSVVFDILTAGTVSTAALAETGSGTATSLAIEQTTVTLVEYGDHVQTTKKLDLTSYSDNGKHAAWKMGHLASDTLDTLARGALDTQTGATWVDYAGSGTAVNDLTITDELSGDDFRKAFAKLRTQKVDKLDGGYYFCYIHPHVLKDIKDETTNTSLTVKELYTDQRLDPIKDEIGIFEGFRLIMSTNCNLQLLAGDGTTTSAASADVYTTYFVGADALGFGKAGQVPEFDMYNSTGGTTDAFKRLQFTSWYALAGFAALQTDSLFKIYSSSSLAANGA